MSGSPTIKEVLKKSRSLFLAVLMVPIIGMIIAIPLIKWRAPGRFQIALPIIILVLAQYIFLVFFISARIDKIIAS